jgi:hypothetical protein
MSHTIAAILAVLIPCLGADAPTAPAAPAPADPAPANPAPGAKAAGEPRRPVTDRPSLGVQVASPRQGQTPGGLTLAYVYPGAAAQEMGFRSGDEILEMNGAPVTDRESFVKELQRQAIGAKVEFKVRRGGETITLSGAMGNFQRTRKAFLEHCRALVGKPFTPVASMHWVDGVDGLASLKGKIGIFISIDGCRDCLQGNWQKFRTAWKALKVQQNVAICAVYSDPDRPFAENLKARNFIEERYSAGFPFGVAKYPGDRPPSDSMGLEPVVQGHGVAIIGPDGSLIYQEVSGFEPDKQDLMKVLQEAAKMLPAGQTPAPAPAPAPAPSPAPIPGNDRKS